MLEEEGKKKRSDRVGEGGEATARRQLFNCGKPPKISGKKFTAKLQDQKITQPHSLDSSIDDTYAQVFGKDQPGRIRGVGTGPTPKSLWGGVSTQVQQQEKKIHLTQFMKDMANKISKIESVVLQVQGKQVKLLNLGGEEVASGILMSEDKEKVVMGK
ncbi:hypothetical protein Taro_028169, partial [Colocasia esculenta]|nr:hypothetical protein [Colocasia esculenta]